MALLLDRPAWPAHGRLWSHLVSDTSIQELHAFARRVGVPSRSFEGDHYDVPAERYDELVAAGARPVEGRELVRALVASGLRLPKRRGERVLDSWPAVRWPGHPVPCRVDCLVSPLPPPSGTTIGTVLLAMRSGQLLLDAGVDALPTPAVLHPGDGGRPCGYLRARFAGDDGAAAGGGAAAVPPESSGTGDGTVRAARRGGGREHVAALRPQTVSDGGLTGRWVPVEDTLLLPALRWWRPLIAHLAGSSAP